VAPSRKNAKIPPIAHASATRTLATKAHPATLSKPPRGIAIVTFAASQWRFERPNAGNE